MLARVLAIAMNAYREAVRARILYGLFALALGTTAYSLVVAALSLHQEARVIADLGAASMSLYAVLVAIVVGATSLYREIELKTIFPILSRPLRRHEYLLGKYLGTVLTLAVFLAIDAGAVLFLLAFQSGQATSRLIAALVALAVALVVLLVRAKRSRVFVFLPWALAFVVVAWLLAGPAGGERRLVVAAATLALCEVSVVAAMATLFASFSSPFLTAVFTVGLFVVGRSADTLANLPQRSFGPAVRAAGRVLARVVPNLHIYVPARPLLLGEVAAEPIGAYVARAAALAALYATVLLVIAAIILRKRDFT